MERTYSTSEIAGIIGIHPNTVRLYEQLCLITAPERKPNGYRIFTNLHLDQFTNARLAFQVEILQNGLYKRQAWRLILSRPLLLVILTRQSIYPKPTAGRLKPRQDMRRKPLKS